MELSREFGEMIQTFESEGTSFIFEDLVAVYYDVQIGDHISLCQGTKRVYYSKAELERLREEGLKRTSDETRGAIAKLDSLIEKALLHADSLRSKTSLTRQEVATALDDLGQAFAGYSYFDPWYWEGVFAASTEDQRAKENVELVQNYKNVVRQQFEPLCFTPDSYLATLLKLLSGQFGIPNEDLTWYRKDDILALFEGIRVPSDELNRRRSAYAYHETGKQTLFYSGEAAKRLASVKQNDSDASPRVILGQAANGTGTIVRAKVRLIRRNYADKTATQKQMDDMQEGEVLVSETTDPELIPAFKKASAVITDLGGMLSHAAITSREMNVPCIVGATNASKILKTGDEVEVDASSGVVKILR